MILYKDEHEAYVDKDQVELFLKDGWSKEKPESGDQEENDLNDSGDDESGDDTGDDESGDNTGDESNTNKSGKSGKRISRRK